MIATKKIFNDFNYIMKITFFATFLLVVGLFSKELHVVAATSRDSTAANSLETALHQLNISTDVKLLDYFPNLKTKAVPVTDACYQPLLNYNGTVVANIFEDDLFTVVKQYFVRGFKKQTKFGPFLTIFIFQTESQLSTSGGPFAGQSSSTN